MKFLDGAATTKEIKRLTGASKNVRMAVAFWGDGATKELSLNAKGKSATVICNLKSGGTNPHEIQKMIDDNVIVRQCDTLHGKVYLFDEHVILGSSNASANGLALQGREVSGWHEANILTGDRSVYNEAVKWVDKLQDRVITNDDLEAAKEAYSKRRAAMTVGPLPSMPLIETIRENPERFKDRRIYVCVYLSLFEPAQIEGVEREREKFEGDTRVDALGWAVPTDARLLLFYINERGIVRFDGIWERPPTEWKRASKLPLYFMRRCSNLDGLSGDGIKDAWSPALLAYRDAEFGADDDGKHIEFGEFYDRYLQQRMTKVLNVLDGHGRLKALGNNEFESGFWFRPGRGYQIIRVFADDGGSSIRGGKVRSVREEVRSGQPRKVFTFTDDASEHGKTRPAFQQNGHAATFE